MNNLKITISEAGKLIGKSDNRTIKKWLERNRISIHYDGREYVYRIEVELELYRPLCQDFKDKYPYDWESRIKSICRDNKELYLLLTGELQDEAYIPEAFHLDYIDPDNSIFKNLYDVEAS
jgi:hypothetical protein